MKKVGTLGKKTYLCCMLSLKKIRDKFKDLPPYINIYTVTIVVVLCWITFFDQDSLIKHRKLQRDINSVEAEIAYYKSETERENMELNAFTNNRDSLETFARERYFMKTSQEVIYIIKEK